MKTSMFVSRCCLAILSLTLIDASARCEDLLLVEWPVSSGGNGHMYALSPTKMTWIEAEAYAVAAGGELASVTSAEEQTFIENSILTGPLDKTPVWIGLNDVATEGQFVWTTGEPVTFTKWNPGEPNNSDSSNSSEDYGVLNYHYSRDQGAKGTWNDCNNTATEFGSVFALIEFDPPNPLAGHYKGKIFETTKLDTSVATVKRSTLVDVTIDSFGRILLLPQVGPACAGRINSMAKYSIRPEDAAIDSTGIATITGSTLTFTLNVDYPFQTDSGATHHRTSTREYRLHKLRQ